MADDHPLPADDRLSSEDVAVLFGVTIEEFRACVDARVSGNAPAQAVRFPRDWIERSRNRAAIYKRMTGRTDMKGALEFWKERSNTAR